MIKITGFLLKYEESYYKYNVIQMFGITLNSKSTPTLLQCVESFKK